MLIDLGPLGWIVLLLFAALPVTSILAVERGVRLALIPLTIAIALIAVPFAYYAFSWPNPGLAGAALEVVALLGAWAILLTVLVLERFGRRRAPRVREPTRRR